MTVRRPFATVVAVAGLGLALAVAFMLAAFPQPMYATIRRCTEPGGLCSSLVRFGHQAGAPILLALLPWSLWRGLGTGLRQWWETRRAIQRLYAGGTDGLTGSLRATCVELKLDGKVTLVDTALPIAFCHGLIRSRVCLSTGTVQLLTPRAMAAVLRHERAHLRQHHPLQLMVARSLAAALPFFPVLGELAEELPRTQELAADREVIRAGERRALAQALLLLAESQVDMSSLPAATGISGSLKARIDQLVGAEIGAAKLSRGAVRRTCLAFGFGVFLLRLLTLGPGPRNLLQALLSPPPVSIAVPWTSFTLLTLVCGTIYALSTTARHARLPGLD